MRSKGLEIQNRTPKCLPKKPHRAEDGLSMAEKRQKIRDILNAKDKEILKGSTEECIEDDSDEPVEKIDRIHMIERFYDFIAEMTAFLPEGEWKQVGDLMVEIKRTEEFLSISLRGKNLPKIYKYRVFGRGNKKENFQYAQFSEGERAFNFTQEERKYSTIEFSSGGDFSATEIPNDLLVNISRFENTVRALLWKKDNS